MTRLESQPSSVLRVAIAACCRRLHVVVEGAADHQRHHDEDAELTVPGQLGEGGADRVSHAYLPFLDVWAAAERESMPAIWNVPRMVN